MNRRRRKRPADDSDSGPAGGTRRNQNVFFLSHHFHEWVTGYTAHSIAQTGVQWLATPLSRLDPLQLTSRGWSSPAILPTWDWTNNRKVISPTPTPTKPRWLWQLRLTQSIYNPSGAQLLQSVHYVVPASKVKKIKIEFHAMLWCCCVDVDCVEPVAPTLST